MTAHVAVVGDAMLDISARLQGPLAHASDSPAQIGFHPGGSGANTARWLARSGCVTVFIGAVGADPAGELIRRALRADGVLDALHVVPDAATGACIVLIGLDGERTMVPDPGANSALSASQVPDDVLTGHLHLSGYTLLNPASREAGLTLLHRARAAGCTVSLDPSSAAPLAAAPQVLDAVIGQVDLIIANRDEAAVLTGLEDPDAACRALAERYPTAVVKLGADGAVARRASEQARVAAKPVAVVDTTGAGDAFAAGLLPAWLEGAGLHAALEAAAVSAASAVGRVGAGPPPPAA